MRGLKRGRKQIDDRLADLGRAIRPAYEGIETLSSNIGEFVGTESRDPPRL